MSGAVVNNDGALINNDTVFRYRVDVRFFEVDSLGVVFNMWYLGWCDEAMSAFMESIGYGYATLRAQGFDAVLRNAEIEWADSLEAFQHAEIVVLVDHVGTTSFRLRYDIDRIDMDAWTWNGSTRRITGGPDALRWPSPTCVWRSTAGTRCRSLGTCVRLW